MILFITKETPSSLKQLEQLKEINRKVVNVPSPLEALKISRETDEIKVILIDIDSIEDSHLFFKGTPEYFDLPVLYTTVKEQEKTSKESFSKDFYGFLPKVVNNSTLEHIITCATNHFESSKKMMNTINCLHLAEELSNFGYWTLDLSKGTVFPSEGTKRIYGLTGDSYPIKFLQSFPLPQYREKLDKALKNLIQDGIPYNTEFKIQNKTTGKIIPIHSVALYDPVRNTITGTLYDISRQKKSEERALRKGEEYREIIQNHNAVMLVIDSNTGAIIMANSSACKYYGWSSYEITEMTIHDINTLSKEEVQQKIISARNRHTNVFHFKHQLADGTIRDVEVFSGPITFENKNCLFSIVYDITDREKAYRRIKHQAYYDSLTNLPNRKLFSDTLKKMAVPSEGTPSHFALLNIDLDHFKDINDNFGHDIGDLLLLEAADRLQKLSGNNSTIFRLGGDEFAFILKDYKDHRELSLNCNKILKTLEEPFKISGNELFISASIGVAIYPADGTDCAELFKHSDLAMYRAKNDGKNRYSFFNRELKSNFKRKIWIETELRKALKEDKLSLHYQPRVDIGQNRIVASEAFIRWKEDNGKYIAPSEFIPIAESSGLILGVDRWVLLTALRQAREWEARGIIGHTISIKISDLHFRHRRILKTLSALSLITPILPGRIEIEISESVFSGNEDLIVPILKELKLMGIGVSIDGFGTGFHSLNFIKRLPVDRIKIDRTFIKNLSTDQCDAAIVKTIITMGNLLNLKVTAEGIQTAEQLKILRESGCTEAQGSYFASPICSQNYEDFYASWPST